MVRKRLFLHPTFDCSFDKVCRDDCYLLKGKSSDEKKAEDAKLATQRQEKAPDTSRFERDLAACEKDERQMPWQLYGFSKDEVEKHKHDDARN